ncbi:MAG: exodeoxyribonuclease VII large subunit [Burkholderiales bacterium]|nr:exodeoxyribonuclease VII large subunit [Burkholderiales bacterium]
MLENSLPGRSIAAPETTPAPADILSVSQFNRSVRDLIEHRYPLLWIRGEVSACVVARSGHAYFVLKDAQAQLRCVMFRNRGQALDWTPRDGALVEAQGLPTLYEARGDFQLVVERMRASGPGALYEAFLRLKARLEQEGLFSEAVKRALPYLPRRIGVITSPQAAALSDVLAAIRRRNAAIPVIVYPVPVQGTEAASAIAAALASAGARRECDVLILCRGGGSIEDLWAFNEERVARAIRACAIPVVCGVGHETDFTIADFAADRRAATPTAAAEMVSPARIELLEALSGLARRLQRSTRREQQIRAQNLDHLTRRLAHPGRRLADLQHAFGDRAAQLARATARRFQERAWRIANLAERMRSAVPRTCELQALAADRFERLTACLRAALEHRELRLASLAANLDHLAPARVLSRGYSLVRDESGAVVTDGATLRPGQRLEAQFARGGAELRVERGR